MRALTFQKSGDYNSRQGEMQCFTRTVDGLESVSDPEVMKREGRMASSEHKHIRRVRRHIALRKLWEIKRIRWRMLHSWSVLQCIN